MGHLTYSVQELERRAAHRDEYINFLRDARVKREKADESMMQTKRNTAAKRDLTDPSGPDLGMDRGLDEPIPPLPPAADKLWLMHADGANGGSRARAPADETKLITKKFKSTPGTQAEVRDCEAELSTVDLHQVTVSHKVMDFGRVCVNSVTARSLSFTNDLSRSVLVQLGRLEKELSKSTPSAQVIPGGAVAGFDMYFSSPTEQTFKKTLQVSDDGSSVVGGGGRWGGGGCGGGCGGRKYEISMGGWVVGWLGGWA